MLRPEHVAGICRKFLDLLSASAKERAGLALDFPDDSVALLIQREMQIGTNLLFGGRRIKSLLETLVEQPLNEWVFFNSPHAGTLLKITADSDTRSLLINGDRADGI